MSDFGLDPRDGLLGDELEVVVGGDGQFAGQVFRDWKELRVTRAIDTAAGSFSLSTPLRAPFGLPPGTRVRVRVAGQPVADGWVDDLAGDSSETKLSVSGRDRSADLLDCSPDPGSPLEYDDISLAGLVNQLAVPFGVTALDQTTGQLERFERFVVQQGETAWRAIERACRLRGVLCFGDGGGDLVLARPGQEHAAAPLVQDTTDDTNVSQAKLVWRTAARFRTYVVRGQRAGSDDGWGSDVSEIEGQATDEGVSRFRPLIVIAEGQVSDQQAKERAEWEATVRAARAQRLEVVTPSWRQYSGGPIWRPNLLVNVRILRFGIDREMLVRQVKYSRGPETACSLELVRRNAYQPQQVIEPEEDPFEDLLSEEGEL